MQNLSDIKIEAVIDSLSVGLYVCDLDRRITYWSKSAERITGWHKEEVVGRYCRDNILCHVDKDGRQLCGGEYCPLHRAMVTGKISRDSMLVYAQGSDGRRIPTQVTVSPVRNDSGEVVGGVETFRDASDLVQDLERAQAIQKTAMETDIPDDVASAFLTHYVPRDIVGGDYYAIKKLEDGLYGVILADVMGHGIASALYTLQLRSLWDQHYPLLMKPAKFTDRMNKGLVKVVRAEVCFATAVCGLVDFKNRTFRFTGAGGPPPLLMHLDGEYECLESPGMPLALSASSEYEERSVRICHGDRLLLFSDGATEITNAQGDMLGSQGLVEILKSQGYPREAIRVKALEKELLKYSNSIRLNDDLTLIDVRLDESRHGPEIC